jgi:hypothetical protein
VLYPLKIFQTLGGENKNLAHNGRPESEKEFLKKIYLVENCCSEAREMDENVFFFFFFFFLYPFCP